MIRTTGFLCFLAFLASGCAPSDPNESRYATPIGPLADDYQDRVKADLARTLAHSEGAIYTFDSEPSIVNMGKRRAGVRDRKSTRLNSSHSTLSRMPSSA